MWPVVSARQKISGVLRRFSPGVLNKTLHRASYTDIYLNSESYNSPWHQLRSSAIAGMRIASAQNILISRSKIPFGAISLGLRKSTSGLLSVRSFCSYEQERSSRRLEAESDFPRPPVIPFEKDLANRIHLIGQVGRKPDIKYFDTGKVCARSSLAVRKTSRSESSPSWFALEFWDELAEIAAHHLKQGDKVHVEGVVVVDSFEKDQKNITIVKVVVRDLNYITQQAETFEHARSPQEKEVENNKLWKDFLGNPSEWWDNRLKKMNPKQPDFRHKTSGAALWVDSSPEWVRMQIRILDLQRDLGTHSSKVSSAPY